MFTTTPKIASLYQSAERAKIKARIEVVVAQKPFASFEIGQGEHVIGRDPGCEICIEDEDVSRQHARLTFSGYDFLMENLGSTNGVFVEGMKIELPTPIYPGQEIQIGRAHLRVSLSEEANRELMEALWDADLGLATVKADLKAPRYSVGATIATGGMGAVIRARDVHIRRVVAMKVMRSEMQFSPENLLRFIDEARLTGQLEHPNIVPMYELGVDEQGRVFYTMKLIKGVTLDEVLKQLRAGNERAVERYPLAHLLNIFQKVCDAIAFAHSKSVVHRDLKPENIMIGGYGEVLVMDWGLAKIHGTRPHGEGREKSAHPDSGRHDHTNATFHTLDGIVVGTPPYIAPEQARGEIASLDARTDIYGLGAVLYEILTLRPPIPCTTVEEVLKKTVEGKIDPPIKYNSTRETEPGTKPVPMKHLPGGKVPEAVSAVTMKALRLNPADRYQTVEELQREIESFQGGFATTAERANIFKQIILLIRRHKANFALLLAGFILVNVMLVAFVVTLKHERDLALVSEKNAKQNEAVAQGALSELRGTAPTFAEEAAQLVDDGRFDEAIQKITYAISQVPNESSYYKLQGDIYESLLRIDDAVKAYETALQRNPKNRDARENLDLCRKLLAQSGGSELNAAQLRTLQIAMRGQNRFAEAVAMMEKIEKDRGLIQDTWREFFTKKKGLKGQVTANEDGTLTVELTKASAPQLSHLRGMPVSVLNLDGTKVGDITGLSGLPLKSLNLNRTDVADLGPLRGMKLEQLSIADTRVADISTLRGMPLQTLNLARTHVRDLSPLRGSPLRELNLEGCRDLTAPDLRPLLECKQLETLLMPQHVKAVGFLRNHPSLRQLSFRKLDQPVDAFWKEFDSAKDAAKNGATPPNRK